MGLKVPPFNATVSSAVDQHDHSQQCVREILLYATTATNLFLLIEWCKDSG
jgi:hypothetical protein